MPDHEPEAYSLHRGRGNWLLFLSLVVAAGAIGVFDYYTGPLLTLSILYLIPISLAAWRLGRTAAWVIVAFDAVPTYLDQVGRVQAGEYSYLIAVVNVAVPVLVYAFVAELVYRLVRVQRELRETAVELRRVYDTLQQDVTAASLLQSAVLQDPLPEVPGLDIAARMIYARELGGDFWEAVNLGDGLHFAVADVTGKGIPAALFTTLLKHLLDEARRFSHDPGRIVDYVNSRLHRQLPDGMFISLFYGHLDVSASRLDYASAGHEPAILYRAHSDQATELDSTVMVMGLQEYRSVPEQVSIDLSSGDVLLVYTDGLTEARISRIRRLGSDFPVQMILRTHGESAESILEHIVREWQRSTLSPRLDDLTLFCIKVMPRE